MNLLLQKWDLRALWTALPLLSKLTLLFLLVVAGVTFISAFRSLLAHSRPRLSDSQRSLDNLRQLHLFAFYFLGVCLADHFFATVNSIQMSRMSLQAAGCESFSPMAWFAFIGFLLLLFSHSVQWFTSIRVNPVSRQTE
jgi:hypothetical protein